MRNFARLPKPVLLLEALGACAVAGALLLMNNWLPAPAAIGQKPLATLLFLLGIALMLPAAWLIMWRTAKVMAPHLFDHTHTRK
ncbi:MULTISPECIES: DUF1418 family protein [Pantoea]|jgi:hypothetical protein|uniref:DUF1418 family protein n=1 Tax=Pantoea eucrina TaxID=472693 RepID=A0ABS1Z2F6_9GAMM|nr:MULTISPECIES: DUF1418 family protein [Pantoea]AIX50718.1 hypothetical protein PSNIH1_10975 [Pantoea sp. PSNIH1]KAA6048064.1 DUF1418 family protein [Pantoea sp. Bo_7]KAA6093309.1 DUF1418 family protein [Pantoea sp. Bo_10]MBM0746590.1 DUF1418 family protein [Pantoea eucrina]MCL9646245.1 DUF1418 family protein [Pantoea eucrina]